MRSRPVRPLGQEYYQQSSVGGAIKNNDGTHADGRPRRVEGVEGRGRHGPGLMDLETPVGVYIPYRPDRHAKLQGNVRVVDM